MYDFENVLPQISPFSKTQLHVLLLPTVFDDSCWGEQLLLLRAAAAPAPPRGDERLSDLTTLLLLVVTTLAAVVIRLGGRGVWGRLAGLTPSTLVFLAAAAVAVVPAGRGGDVKIVVAAFVHGVRLLRLMVWPGVTGVRPLTEAPGGSCSALSPLILMGIAPWGRVMMFLK